MEHIATSTNGAHASLIAWVLASYGVRYQKYDVYVYCVHVILPCSAYFVFAFIGACFLEQCSCILERLKRQTSQSMFVHN